MNQQERIGAAISLSNAAAEVMSMSGRGTFMHNLGERLAAVAREQLDIASPPAKKVVTPVAAALDVVPGVGLDVVHGVALVVGAGGDAGSG